MGLFDFFKKDKTDVDLFYEEQNHQSIPTGSSKFLLIVDDVFSITNRETVVVGTVQSGSISVGDTLTIIGKDGEQSTTSVIALEQFRKMISTASTGDNIGICLEGISINEIKKGDKIIK